MVKNNLAYSLDVISEREPVINESPVKWCEITLSDVINRGKRLEASVFDVDSKRAYQVIKHCKYSPVSLISAEGPVAKAHYGGRLKRNYVEKTHEKAVGFIGSSEMLDIKPQPVKFMVESPKVQDLRVKEGTVLLSRSGTIGNMSFVNKTLSRLLISEHAMRLECKGHPGYVYAFLKSPTGRLLIRSNIYGAVISQVEPEHIATIPIPNAPVTLKQKINDLIVRSYELRDESNELIDEAMQLLVDELALPPIVDMQKLSAPVNAYSVKLSDMNLRLDASYHVPVVDAIIQHLQAYAAEVTTVGDSRISKNVFLPGRFARVYVEEGYGCILFGGKQLYELDPSNKKYLSATKHGKRISDELEIEENWTLITRSGTIGKVTLTPKHWEHWVASEHIIRVVPANDDIAGYISIFLASDYGYQLITRYTYGSVVDEIDDGHVRQIPIPILKNAEVQKRINSLALEANAKRTEAYQLEQEALRIMNDEVIYAK